MPMQHSPVRRRYFNTFQRTPEPGYSKTPTNSTPTTQFLRRHQPIVLRSLATITWRSGLNKRISQPAHRPHSPITQSCAPPEALFPQHQLRITFFLVLTTSSSLP